MARKKSIKKHLQVGSIIKVTEPYLMGSHSFYEVTELLSKSFKCKIIGENYYDNIEYSDQEFCYNIYIKIYNLVATNY